MGGSKPGTKPGPKPIDERKKVNPEPTEMLGSIRVQCSPAGSEIRIDGESHGVTPREIDGISPGQHSVDVSKTGYASRSWMVDVQSGGISEVKGTLRAIAPPTPQPSPNPDPTPSRTKMAIIVGVIVGVSVFFAVSPGSDGTGGGGETIVDTIPKVDSVQVTPNVAPMPEPVDEAVPTGSVSVTCTPAGSTIKIDGKRVGSTPMEVSGLSVGSHTVEVSKDGYKSRSWSVTVSANSTASVSGSLSEKKTATQTTNQTTTVTSGTINGHEWVDLGLSVKWATCNVGASGPSDYGNYYAWGETRTKSTYTEENSKTYKNSSYDFDIAGYSNYDAARANWGGSWRLPTKAEMDELENKCTWT